MSLEELTFHPKLWRGSGDGLKTQAIPSGFTKLDGRLPGGGWPQQAITEIFVERYGIGELTLLMPACANRRGLVWIAPPYIPYAPALVRHGINLEHVLVVQPSGPGRNVLWAAEQVLRSRSNLTMLAWLDSLSFGALRRLQLAIEEQNSWAVFFRPMSALANKSPAALRIMLTRQSGRTPEDFQVRILKCRGGKPGIVHLDLSNCPWSQKRSIDDGGIG